MIAILGFVGLGAMGAHMCRNLATRSGARVLAADLDPEAVRQAAAVEGVQASTVDEIARTADIVFLSLPSIAEVEAVCLGDQGLAANAGALKTIVDMSTSDVGRTRELAQRLAERGLGFLDAPVARSRQAARDGTLLITVGGPAVQLEKVRPYLACMGSDIVHCGGIGVGQVAKIMNNMVLVASVNALAEAFAIAESTGMEPAQLAQTLALGSADSYALKLTGADYLARDRFPEKMFSAAYALKDMRLALRLAQEQGIDAALADQTASRLETAIEKGWGEAYYPVMVRVVKDASTG